LNQVEMPKYIIYCRKSTDEKEKQALPIVVFPTLKVTFHLPGGIGPLRLVFGEAGLHLASFKRILFTKFSPRYR